MKNQKLGIDLDTTLNNLNEEWLRRYNDDYDDNLKEYPTWDINKWVKPECGEKIFNYLHEPNFFYNLGIRENAKEVFEFLSNYFDIYIVTAYSVDACVDKVRWVEKHLPNFNVENIIFCNDKSVLNLDYLIDDGPHNIVGFKQIGIIYDMSYNRYLKNCDWTILPRVCDWLDIKNLFVENYIINHE
jgi:5'-nucleotidase